MRALRRVAGRPVLALFATLALVCAGCGGSSTPRVAPTPSPTPIARLNTAEMVVPRIDFCSLVPATAVRRALGHRPAAKQRWANGDTTSLPGLGKQIVAEHGCAWSAGATTASAWTYAPPVTPALARTLVHRSRHQPHCRDLHGATFGDPSVAQLCAHGTTHRFRHAGLFGDTWLTCGVSSDAPVHAVRKRADAWCVDIANTLNTTR